MDKLLIDPSKIKAFGFSEKTHFCLVTNKSLAEFVELKENKNYVSTAIVDYKAGDNFNDLLKDLIPEYAHVLVISPDVFFQSPSQELVGKNRKLLAMACNSTPTDLKVIEHFLKVIENTDPDKQQAVADRFFDIGENAQYLEFIDVENGTYAKFNHLDESYLWSEQAGTLGNGEQQLAPSGEISVLPLRIQEFDENLRLDFNGTIALQGTPILHNGTPSFLRSDQYRLHKDLDGMKNGAVIATVENGVITSIKANSDKAELAVQTLNNLFSVDSRYRILWEIGFGVNSSNIILDGNNAMNETYGGEDGAIHFGLGLTPYTQYHLDIICPKTIVKSDGGEYLIGKKTAIKRNKAIGCPCIE